MAKAVAIGFEDIKEIIDKNRYYVDKTLMIRDLLDRGGKVNLFTRPRRFGKTGYYIEGSIGSRQVIGMQRDFWSRTQRL